MASKTISIKEEAYNRLKALKTEDKIFTDVILDLTKDKNKKFENIIGEGIDTSFKDLKNDRERAKEDEEREAPLR